MPFALTADYCQPLLSMQKQRKPRHNPLSDREMEALRLMAQGLSSDEIAEAMGVRKVSVDYLSERIYEKLNARNRVHAVMIAMRRGYVPLYGVEGS